MREVRSGSLLERLADEQRLEEAGRFEDAQLDRGHLVALELHHHAALALDARQRMRCGRCASLPPRLALRLEAEGGGGRLDVAERLGDRASLRRRLPPGVGEGGVRGIVGGAEAAVAAASWAGQRAPQPVRVTGPRQRVPSVDR